MSIARSLVDHFMPRCHPFRIIAIQRVGNIALTTEHRPVGTRIALRILSLADQFLRQ